MSGNKPLSIILATGNAHKAEEFSQLAAAHGLAAVIRTAADIGGMPPVREDAGSFGGNAAKKALAVRAIAPPEAWVLADDSGLLCDALNGAPGVSSARYAGEGASDAANRAKLLDALRDVDDAGRAAHFFCQLVLIAPDGVMRDFCGVCRGRILRAETGGGGFGYDPIFLPDSFARSFAELTPEEKNRVSHRGLAFAALAESFKNRAP
jgi:XTP/dITP diphosphohydrolase